jgi:Family of unknown function (DUF6220)
MTRYARIAFAGLAWLFVAAVVIQVFLIGLGLFGDVSYRQTHIEFGYSIGILVLLLLIAALVARPGLRTVGLVLGLFVLYIVQTLLPSARQAYPAIAALHPVNALLMFGLALYVARSAMALARLGGQSDAHVAPAAVPRDAVS